MKSVFVLVNLLALAFLAGCSSSAGASPAPTSQSSAPGATSVSPAATPTAQSYKIDMTDAEQFSPASITVPRGSTITWLDTGQQQHTVTDDPTKAVNPADAVLPAGAQAWDSGSINAAGTFSHTFDTPGQYTYFCIPHETLGMIGHVTVTP